MENSISYLLDELHKFTVDDDLTEWCNNLCEFYNKNERHSYAEITEFILSQDGGLEYIYKFMPILEKVKDDFKEVDREGMYLKLLKLIDHINLEIIRISYIEKNTAESIRQQYIDLNNEQSSNILTMYEEVCKQVSSTQEIVDTASIQQKNIEEDLNDIEKKMEHITKTAKDAENTVKNAQKESVTLLGIFAAIVLSFTGGMAFSSSVLANMDKLPLYDVVLVALFVGVVLFNVISVLLYTIKSIHEKTCKHNYVIYFAGNILFVLIIISIFYLKMNSSTDMLKEKENQLNRIKIEQQIKDYDKN